MTVKAWNQMVSLLKLCKIVILVTKYEVEGVHLAVLKQGSWVAEVSLKI